MWLKISIFITFILLVISLFSSLVIVYKDKGQTKKPLAALIIRVSLAVILMAQVTYGLFSGQLGSRAPWDSFEPAAYPSSSTGKTISSEASKEQPETGSATSAEKP